MAYSTLLFGRLQAASTRGVISTAFGLAALQVAAQQAVQTITVTGSSSRNSASVAGFGDVPLVRSPFSASVITTAQLADAGISQLGDITRLDAAATDAYNAPGYWGQLAVRGFTLDNRFNYRRDGLPINAETVIASDNKASLEILKGTSGVQAGTSAPGGLVNLVVKRPRGEIRSFGLGWEQDGSVAASVDIGSRSGAFGWRVNGALARLDPPLRASSGHRRLLAAAADYRFANGALIEAEIEFSEQSQPSMPGFSLLGLRLPSADSIDPRINLNDQPWSLPVVFRGQTGSIRWTQPLGADWNASVHLLRQRLTTDDRIAFPFGCSAENRFDRYCSDGSFDLYDYRSEGERRTSDAVDLALSGQSHAMGLEQRLGVGLLLTRYSLRTRPLAYNFVGVGTIDGLAIVPPDPSTPYANTLRDEHTTEWRVQDAITLDDAWSLWAGVRQTRLQRSSAQTDGSAATDYHQAFTTPWLAFSRAFGPRAQLYASWGQGVESDVAPNLPMYRNAGQALPAAKSRQIEVGYKRRTDAWELAIAAFDIRRPLWSDVGACDGSAASCEKVSDGHSRHRGIEAEAEWKGGTWTWRASAMLLRARREGAADARLNGLRPTNVPATSLKLQAAYNVGALPGLACLAFVTREGERVVLPDNSITTPGWTRLDLGARYTQRHGTQQLVWRVGIDNAADARAWKEAPFQFGHAYLYPLPPRSLHASVQSSW